MWLGARLLFISFAIVNSEFLNPKSRFGTGLTRISEQENIEVNEKCGVQPGMNKMNDGTIAKKGQFPWAVAIESNQLHRFCSGTIISQRHVLTAAHCAVDLELLDFEYCNKKSVRSERHELNEGIVGGYVAYGGNCDFNVMDGYTLNRTGSPCQKDDLKRVPISSVAWEKKYRDRPPGKRCTNYDIAIIEVANDFQWSDFTRPACLLKEDFDFSGMVASFVGFGTVLNGEEKEFYPDLRYGSGTIKKNDTTSTLIIAPRGLTDEQREKTQTSRNSQIESGDSGGGIEMGCAKTVLIGILTDTLKGENKKSRGGQISPHLHEICELTGVCPIENHCG